MERATQGWMGWYYIKGAQSGVERGTQEVDGLVPHQRCTEWCGESHTRGGWAGTHRCTKWCGERYTTGGWTGTTSKMHRVVWREVREVDGLVLTGVPSGVERGTQEVDGLVLTGAQSGVERGTQEGDGLVLHQRCTKWCGERYTRGGWAGTYCTVLLWSCPYFRGFNCAMSM